MTRPHVLVWLIVALLLVDVRAALYLRAGGCGGARLPRPSTLQIQTRVVEPDLVAGRTVHAEVTITNLGSQRVQVLKPRAVLTEPVADRTLTWSQPSDQALNLAPGEYGALTLPVHVSRCAHQRSPALTPGFAELVVILQITGVGERRSPSVAVVIRPG